MNTRTRILLGVAVVGVAVAAVMLAPHKRTYQVQSRDYGRLHCGDNQFGRFEVGAGRKLLLGWMHGDSSTVISYDPPGPQIGYCIFHNTDAGFQQYCYPGIVIGQNAHVDITQMATPHKEGWRTYTVPTTNVVPSGSLSAPMDPLLGIPPGPVPYEGLPYGGSIMGYAVNVDPNTAGTLLIPTDGGYHPVMTIVSTDPWGNGVPPDGTMTFHYQASWGDGGNTTGGTIMITVSF